MLDETETGLLGDPDSATEIVAFLACRLRELKRMQTPDAWQATVEECRRHRVYNLLHEDPLTARAFLKPRGYQEDAELLDIIYQRDWRDIYDGRVSRLGESIFRYTITCKAPSAVRARRDVLAAMIDDICERRSHPHILSVACGHLREASQSSACRAGRVGRFVGLDHDPRSIAVVDRELSCLGIEPICGTLKLVLAGPLAKQRFDFVYAAGLYDYLDDRLSQLLTGRLFQMLRPGGRLLVANYLPDIEDVGYMEAYMGWSLMYRNAETMTKLVSNIPSRLIAAQRPFHDPSDTIVYLQMERGE
jgi:SAM-dependent methyltransferase